MNDKVTTKTIRMSYDNFEAAITSFLYSVGALHDDEEVLASDFGVELFGDEDDPMVEFELDIMKVQGN